MTSSVIEQAYSAAREKYAALEVNTDDALDTLRSVAVSIHCWQADDVSGFERPEAELSGGGIQITGSYPGKARTIDELRDDLDKAMSLIPGRHRLNLHAIYGEFGGKPVDRDEITAEHFAGWVEWARERGIGLDFNATCFSHSKADSGFTLSSRERAVRDFWIEHVSRCREIGAYMGRELGTPCIHNLWIPDGSKDITINRFVHRSLLIGSLDAIYEKTFNRRELGDAVESKLFGIGSEWFVVGSHEFYLCYALTRALMLCLDTGHFHPTESVADKLPALLQFTPELLLHVSRGVRWDSDHVVILNDEVIELMAEIVRCGALDRVHIALDFFDGSINRVGAYAIGARAVLKALLMALLEPKHRLREYEKSGDNFARLALLEEMKTMPFGAVWDYFCLRQDAPGGTPLIEEVKRYEKEVLSKRI